MAILIAPVERDLQLIKDRELELIASLDTHVHADHLTGARRLKQRSGCKSACPAMLDLPCADIGLEEDRSFKVGNIELHPAGCVTFPGIQGHRQAVLFSQDVDQQLGQVVAIDIRGVRLFGFVMQQDARLPGSFDDDDERVAVYLAISYQLGGFTVCVPKSRVTLLDVPTDQAMRAVLTGGSLQSAT